MDKFEIGDLVRLRSGAGWSGIGLVTDTHTREWSSACVLIDEQKWWITFEKLERLNDRQTSSR